MTSSNKPIGKNSLTTHITEMNSCNASQSKRSCSVDLAPSCSSKCYGIVRGRAHQVARADRPIERYASKGHGSNGSGGWEWWRNKRLVSRQMFIRPPSPPVPCSLISLWADLHDDVVITIATWYVTPGAALIKSPGWEGTIGRWPWETGSEAVPCRDG